MRVSNFHRLVSFAIIGPFLVATTTTVSGQSVVPNYNGRPADMVAQRAEQGILVNADVIKLLGSNLSQAAIIDIIRKSKSWFDIGPAGMAGLIDAKVPDAVIQAMVEASLGQATPSLPAAQQPAGQDIGHSRQDDTLSAGMREGEILGESLGTGGRVALGFGIGLLAGLIGTGIGFATTGPAPMSADALQRYSNKGPEYQLGFKSGWDKKTKSKKRNSFLMGGLLGTAAFVAVLVSVSGQN